MSNLIKNIIAISIVVFPLLASGEGQIYERGDCITPTLESYSWYGKYAKVEALTPIEGFTSNKVYILAFPFNASNNSIFNKNIEKTTMKVKPSLCDFKESQ